MSELNHYISLRHRGGVLDHPGVKELIVSPGHKCGCCHGNGWFWGVGDDGQSLKRSCAMCGGSGELTALVSIEWQRSKASVEHRGIRNRLPVD